MPGDMLAILALFLGSNRRHHRRRPECPAVKL
jgi:hypothetical protein